MRKPLRPSVLIWGILTIVVAALMLEAGVREVLAWWGRGLPPVVMGVLGACASSLLLVSGVALLRRTPTARSTVIAGAVTMIVVHLLGWMLGIVGLGGALPGVGYPMLLLIVLKARPNLGAPMNAAGSHVEEDVPSLTSQSLREEVMTVS